MNENTSLCWDCHEVRTCLQATARGTVACPAYEQQPYPPGPARPPIGTYCADRLWANTPKHLHPKSQDEHRDERIKSLETTVLEQDDIIESLSAECERYRREIEQQAAKIERLTWRYDDGSRGGLGANSAGRYCLHCGARESYPHAAGCIAREE